MTEKKVKLDQDTLFEVQKRLGIVQDDMGANAKFFHAVGKVSDMINECPFEAPATGQPQPTRLTTFTTRSRTKVEGCYND